MYTLIDKNTMRVITNTYDDIPQDWLGNGWYIRVVAPATGEGDAAYEEAVRVDEDTKEATVRVVRYFSSTKKEREFFMAKGIEYKGHWFQIDKDSQTLITGKALRLQLDPTTTDTVSWRSKANIMVEFTPQEFIEFAKAVSDKVEEVMLNSFNKEG